MAKSKAKSAAKASPAKTTNPLFCEIPSFIDKLKFGSSHKASQGHILGEIFVYGSADKVKTLKLVSSLAPAWQQETLKTQIEKQGKEVIHFAGANGPVWLLAQKNKKEKSNHEGRIEESAYAWCRDQIGSLVGFFKAYQLTHVNIHLEKTVQAQDLGVLVGLDLATYSYRQVIEERALTDVPQVFVKKSGGQIAKTTIDKARSSAHAVNLARHMVNVPPNYLNPTTVAEFAMKTFKAMKNTTVSVWDYARLQKEGMGLHVGVGQGAEHLPCLVHIHYKGKSKKAPLAFVGKGVTFDTGGLDIKPSSGMRLMKKDMGGSAAVTALAHWVCSMGHSRPMDFYLALAENSVDAKSMRPSDVLTARNGMKVEIHNTDAEGRLVLADALDVAVTQETKPELVINVATLTGAIKVALGADLAGLFSNDDKLSEALNRAGQKAGDYSWKMPLFPKYTSNMSTPFADIVNAVDGFGGAITAALFLEKFVRDVSWAHLDIYAWADKAGGALTSAGGSGQSVQALIEFLETKN